MPVDSLPGNRGAAAAAASPTTRKKMVALFSDGEDDDDSPVPPLPSSADGWLSLFDSEPAGSISGGPRRRSFGCDRVPPIDRGPAPRPPALPSPAGRASGGAGRDAPLAEAARATAQTSSNQPDSDMDLDGDTEDDRPGSAAPLPGTREYFGGAFAAGELPPPPPPHSGAADARTAAAGAAAVRAAERRGRSSAGDIDSLLDRILPGGSQLEAIVQQTQIAELQEELENLRREHAGCAARLSAARAEAAVQGEGRVLSEKGPGEVARGPRSADAVGATAGPQPGDCRDLPGADQGAGKWNADGEKARDPLVREGRKHAEEMRALRQQLEADRIRHQEALGALRAELDRARGTGRAVEVAAAADARDRKAATVLEREKTLHKQYRERMDARVAYLEMQLRLAERRGAGSGRGTVLDTASVPPAARKNSGSSPRGEPGVTAPTAAEFARPPSSFEIFACRWCRCQMAFPSPEALKRHVAAHFAD